MLQLEKLTREQIADEYDLIRAKINPRPRSQRDAIVKAHLWNKYQEFQEKNSKHNENEKSS